MCDHKVSRDPVQCAVNAKRNFQRTCSGWKNECWHSSTEREELEYADLTSCCEDSGKDFLKCVVTCD